MPNKTLGKACRLIIGVFLALAARQPIAQAASTVPSGGAFTAGAGNISAAGNALTITQSTLRGIIDWSNFSISKNGAVTVENGAGATLNRVTGGLPSAILGQLLASGSVYILNPQGVLIGRGATIRTGGDFLASTLNLSNSAFLNGGPLVFSGPSTAAVINLGDLTSTGGSIYLIGHSVQNGGGINAPNGTIGLAAGSQVLIADSAADQRVFVQAPGGDIANSGYISAAQVELRSNGGNIYALAGNTGGQIRATGTAVRDGHIWLIAENGTANVSGLISATNANGTGGSIETSGARVVTDNAQITTGKGGNWLLDPDDLTIGSALAGTIETSLNGGTNVTEQTTPSGTGGNGDITVASSIAWNGAADLTLSAFRNIQLSAGISNTGSGNLTLRADNTSIGIGSIAGSGVIDFSGSTGSAALLYNPSSYANPTNYAANFGSVNGAWAAPANGSVSSQYTAYMLVNTAADLENISNNPSSSATYALGQNIDLSGVSNFTPVAGNAPYGNFFGIFDGMGHSVSNLTLSSSNSNDVGFFQSIIGQVRNLNLVNVNITTNANNETVGAMAGEMQGIISNSSATGVIHAGAMTNQVVDYVGGLVGDVGFGATIQNSHASVTIDAGANNNAAPGGSNLYAGGLAGSSLPGVTISNSFASGSVTVGNNATVGGLVGSSVFGQITTSYATGNVSGGLGVVAGGLVGDNISSLVDTYARGNVTGRDSTGMAGGLVGYLESSGSIATSYSSGSVSPAGSNAGGLVGRNDGSSNITSSYWDTQASGFPTIGVGSGDPGGTTGLTTAQLQSGVMPSGFNGTNTVWVAPANVYPYFGWQGPLVTISGSAYNGSSAIPSANVSALSGGTILGTTTTAGNGFYSFLEPQNMTQLGPGVLTYLTSNGTANDFSDGSRPFTGMYLLAGSLAVLNASSSSLSSLSAAMAATLGGNSGSNFLFGVPGGQLSLSAGTTLLLATLPNFTINQPLIVPGSALIEAFGNLTLGSPLTAGTGNSISIAVGQSFTNTAGSNALGVTGGGRWLVYSQNPANDSLDGLLAGFKQYNAVYGSTQPAQAGNGLLYTYAPYIIPTLVGATTKTYDGTTSATLVPSNFASTGEVLGDTVTFAFTGASYNSANAGSALPVTASGLSIASASSGGIPVYGYQMGEITSASGNIGVITPALLTYTANSGSRLYGAVNPTFTGGISGFVDGQTQASATAGVLSFTSPATALSNTGAYAVNGSGLSADNGNYTFTQAAGNASALTIDPALLTYTAAGGTRTYGSPNPPFSGTVSGFVNGQTQASATTGLLSFTSPATTTAGTGSWAIDGSGLTANFGNYTFTQAAGNATALTVSAAVITPTLTPVPNPTAVPTATLLNLIVPTAPLVPAVLPAPADSFISQLEPVNATGLFQIDISNLGNSFSVQQTPLTESSIFSTPEDKKSKYFAGAKP